MVTQVHDMGRQPVSYKWIIQNPLLRESQWGRPGLSSSAVDGDSSTGFAFQTSMSSAMTSTPSSNASDEDYKETASSSVADVHQYKNDYDRDTDEFSGSYPNYGGHARRG